MTQILIIIRDETGHQTIEGQDGWLTIEQAIEVLRRLQEREQTEGQSNGT